MFDTYSSIYGEEEFSEDDLKVYFERIEEAFKQNQREHEKFKDCQLELEENIRDVLFAAEYKHGLVERQIGKRLKLMDNRFDGLDIYSVRVR